MKQTIIAEIGTSHGGSIDKAKELIDTAISSGCDCVKFQYVYADEILHPNTGFVDLPTGKIRLYDRFKELEVSQNFFYECMQYIHKKGASFMCSPFGLRSLKELVEIKPDYLKIASPELNHFPLLKEMNKTKNTPIVLSSGVSMLDNIKDAISIFSNINRLTLLHCITSYPAPEEEYNLSVLQTLSNSFNIKVGISDHSLDPVLVPVYSMAFGSSMIEKHITLSKKDMGLDDPVALDGKQFEQMVHAVRQAEELTGSEIEQFLLQFYPKEKLDKVKGNGIKVLAKAEENNYSRTNRSIHVLSDMKKGQIIKETDIAILRTEKVLNPGMSPKFYETVIGKTLSKDIQAGQGLTQDYLTEKL